MESGNRLWERNGTIVVPSGGRYRTVLLYDLLPPIYMVGMCLLIVFTRVHLFLMWTLIFIFCRNGFWM